MQKRSFLGYGRSVVVKPKNCSYYVKSVVLGISGSGTSKNEYTARRGFKNSEVFSQITGIEKKLIINFQHILIAISCELEVDSIKFGTLCKETSKMYINKYSWFPMPATLHKILIHGEEIIKTSILPIGMMSEEAQEARHKDNKFFRLHHAMKSSRQRTMSDVTNRLLVTSDPLISCKLKKKRNITQTSNRITQRTNYRGCIKYKSREYFRD